MLDDGAAIEVDATTIYEPDASVRCGPPLPDAIIHHARDEAEAIATRIVSDGALVLDPPGIELRDLFG